MMSAQLHRPGAAAGAAIGATDQPTSASPGAGPSGQQHDSESASLTSGPMENKAVKSNSPYVRSQAGSAVKWQLLDDEAVRRAANENKPIFLHVGFRACHYCRLTCQDSFSNPSVAALLNESFVPVIVDREERPDVDTIYMNYIQAINSAGGWPLNVFLTPELEPIFGGTYWPGPGVEQATGSTDGEEADEERIDLLTILEKLKKVWQEQEPRCRKEAKEIVKQLQEFAAEGTLGAKVPEASIGTGSSRATMPTATNARPSQELATKSNQSSGPEEANANAVPGPATSSELDLDLDQLEEAYSHLASTFDKANGGFGYVPKFPTPAKLSFLLRLAHFPGAVADVVGDEETKHATYMALHTLRRIRDSGLRDHVGAGFARYSVTADWTMPHFEKMVADNALLLGVYLDAWLGQSSAAGRKLTQDDEFADIVFELADYLTTPPVLRDDGGFATSEAADSFYRRGDRHMREGAYYLWPRREFDTVVGAGENGQHASTVAAAHWNVLEDGNIPRDQDPNDEFLNQNVLSVAKDFAELSRHFGIPVAEVRRFVSTAKQRLGAHREKERVRPETDIKAVAAYNGMAIAVVARTATAVGIVDMERSKKYLAAAEKAAAFVKEKLWDADKKVLYRTFDDTRSDTLGFADDYAFMIDGLMELYEATGQVTWLQWADELQQIQLDLFHDSPLTASTASPARPNPASAHRASSSGGFYSTKAASPHAILRLKDGMDTVQPSTNAISAANLFRLAAALNNPDYAVHARDTLGAFEVEMLQYPWLFIGLLSGVVAARLGVRSFVILNDGGEEAAKLLHAPRAESRAVVRLNSYTPTETNAWLLSRNEPLAKLVADKPPKGVYELRGGQYVPLNPVS